MPDNSQNNNSNNNQRNNLGLAPHEILELHELINIGIIGVRRTQADIAMIQDPQLKGFMQESLNLKKASVQQMQNFFSNQANLSNGNNEGNQSNQGNKSNQSNQANESNQDNQNQGANQRSNQGNT